MKNLKRALSFAVAAVMLVGMMAIGTSAFTDDAAIASDNEVAVNVMYNLGIINGKPDGSFDPTATVTRGEMAKMICVALNGGKDPVLDTTASTYPDTVGHWAAGYIEYCTAMGIVAGSTDGNFYPNAPITGVEAAKMVLVAVGYNAEHEKFVNNANWSNNISIVANNNGLWEDVASLPGAAISRENAAQLLYNGLTVDCVGYTFQLGSNNGELTSVPVVGSASGKTNILNDKFGMKSTIVTLYDVSYDAEEEEYTYTFSTNPGDTGLTTGTVDYSELFMQEVTVLWKEGTELKNNDDKLYGMFGNGEVLATGAFGDLGAYDADEEGYAFGDIYVPAEDGALANKYAYLNMGDTGAELYEEVAILDADGDGNADCVIVYPYSIKTVDFVGKTYVKIDTVSYKYEENTIYAGIAVGDYAKVVEPENAVDNDPLNHVITKVETVAGTPVATNKDGELKIGDAWYTELVDGTLALNTEYNMVIVGSYILHAEEADEEAVALTDVVYVVDVDAKSTSFSTTTQKVKVMYTDGTTAVVTASKVDAKVAGTVYAIADDNLVTNGLFTYEVDKDGNYELTAFTGADYVGGAIADANEGKFTTAGGDVYRLAADVILFADIDGEVSIVKAADANKWVDSGITGVLYGEEKNGFVYAQIGLVDTSADVDATDAVYGMIVGDYYIVKDEDKVEWVKVSVWNGTENIELTIANADVDEATLLVEGQLVAWYFDGEGNTQIDALGATEAAVTAYDGTNIAINGIEYEFDEDAVILYVDSEEVEGVVEGEIVIADEDEAAINNVYVVTNDTKITVLVVEINNAWTSGAVKG